MRRSYSAMALSRSPDCWHWKYGEAPFDTRTWVAVNNGKFLAQQSAFIMDLKVGNSVVKAAQLLDSATHPNYRRQGIILKLTKNTFDELDKSGIHILYGFPNAISYKKNKTNLSFINYIRDTALVLRTKCKNYP